MRKWALESPNKQATQKYFTFNGPHALQVQYKFYCRSIVTYNAPAPTQSPSALGAHTFSSESQPLDPGFLYWLTLFIFEFEEMATLNPFGLLGDDDAEDPSLLLAAQKKAPAPAPAQPKKDPAKAKPEAKLPTKPAPPAQAVRELRNEGPRGGRGGARGRGGRGYNNRETLDSENAFGNSNGFSGGYSKPSEDGDGGKASSERRPYGGPRGGFRGGRRGGFNNEETFDGRRLNEFKREGSGRGNWGTPTDEIIPETEEPINEVKNVEAEKEPGQEDAGDAKKDAPANEQEEAEPEEKEMTLEEYEKVLEEKRKALVALKAEERKVNVDKELESMQILSNKKNDDEVFIKLGSDKDKRKEAAEKAKKSVSINEFLKPTNGENYYRGGGRGRGRGRGGRGSVGNDHGLRAPAIEDVGQFPSLGGK
ncbi:nuclear RNA binding protein-like [Striga asiatica]|uniref:Nuclear RNA binding protein-like n=1 Tax=Striga asiatica TaxID=4170 RepID=A0A5A7PPS8_STRAF|nr:nuclear RNA binding protein-like [Striga asiatica]